MADLVLSDDGDEALILLEEAAFAELSADGDVGAALDPAARAYLCRAGVSRLGTWAAFGLGNVTADMLARLRLSQRRTLAGVGVNIPTWLPDHQHAEVAGVVRLTPGQNKHGFITRPVGIAGPRSLATAERVILTDHPLLALHLHQAGALDVALVEDPLVLATLRLWLSGRALICASSRTSGLITMQTALTAVLGEGTAAIPGVLVSTVPGRFADDVRAVLGLPPASVTTPPEPISLRLLADLHRHSERQLETAGGLAALAAFGITDRRIINAYRIGYLAPDFRLALSQADRRALHGRAWGGSLVFPAIDAAGVVVDLLVAESAERGHVDTSVWEQPRGMLAPLLATVSERLAVTDSPRRIGRLFQTDVPALLLRGPADAQANAGRLAAGGVKTVDLHAHREVDAMAAALHAVGIIVHGIVGARSPRDREPLAFPTTAAVAVEPATAAPAAPALPTGPSLSLELIHHDVQREVASFRYGPVLFEASIPWRTSTVLSVACLVGDRRHADNRLDVAQPEQRRRFAQATSERTGVASTVIDAGLRLLADAVVALAVAARQPAPVVAPAPSSTGMTTPQRAQALDLLRDPHLLDHLRSDLDALGWLGDHDAKELVVLASLSRLADEPLWLALTAGTPGERFPALRCLAAITPADQIVHLSRLTDTALFNAAPDTFRHRLLLLDDVTTLSPTVATALRILHARGSLSGSQVERDGITGAMRTTFSAAHGPLAVIAAAPGAVPAALHQHLLAVPLDDSMEQTARHLAAKRRALANPQRAASRDLQTDPIATGWRNALSLLRPATVAIPDADEVALPPLVARSRPLQDAAFGLITASALLHQHQRLRSDGAIIATSDDIRRGVRLALHLAACRASDLSVPARQLLTRLWTARLDVFVMDDLAGLLPESTRWGHRAAVDELARLDYVDAGRGGRGKIRQYTLVAAVPGAGVGGLAAVGGDSPPTATRDGTHA